VTSIIYQLRKEQAAGSIPEFTFVSLNGMEMRHPFDTYVRLWEAVSPNKEKLNRPKALAKLQLYFSDSSPLKKVSRQQKGDDTRRAVVLLVDEIDYLVTKKESILYNLFDWPMTGYENKSDAQLIVIGISNTLNLPERLHVRLQSRIGKQRCIFNSYSADDSLKIIEGKLGVSINEGKVRTIFSSLLFLAMNNYLNDSFFLPSHTNIRRQYFIVTPSDLLLERSPLNLVISEKYFSFVKALQKTCSTFLSLERKPFQQIHPVKESLELAIFRSPQKKCSTLSYTWQFLTRHRTRHCCLLHLHLYSAILVEREAASRLKKL